MVDTPGTPGSGSSPVSNSLQRAQNLATFFNSEQKRIYDQMTAKGRPADAAKLDSEKRAANELNQLDPNVANDLRRNNYDPTVAAALKGYNEGELRDAEKNPQSSLYGWFRPSMMRDVDRRTDVDNIYNGIRHFERLNPGHGLQDWISAQLGPDYSTLSDVDKQNRIDQFLRANDLGGFLKNTDGTLMTPANILAAQQAAPAGTTISGELANLLQPALDKNGDKNIGYGELASDFGVNRNRNWGGSSFRSWNGYGSWSGRWDQYGTFEDAMMRRSGYMWPWPSG